MSETKIEWTDATLDRVVKREAVDQGFMHERINYPIALRRISDGEVLVTAAVWPGGSMGAMSDGPRLTIVDHLQGAWVSIDAAIEANSKELGFHPSTKRKAELELLVSKLHEVKAAALKAEA